jgi:hypothetical protein
MDKRKNKERQGNPVDGYPQILQENMDTAAKRWAVGGLTMDLTICHTRWVTNMLQSANASNRPAEKRKEKERETEEMKRDGGGARTLSE